MQLALADVPASFHEFQDAVSLAKGWVSVGKLVEDNKAKIEAQFDFDVPAQPNGQQSRNCWRRPGPSCVTSSQVGANDLATDQKVGYRLMLCATASIPPQEKTLIKFEVADVDAKSLELKQLIVGMARGGSSIRALIASRTARPPRC